MATQNVALNSARVQPDSGSKTCQKCGVEAALSDFYAHPCSADGRDNTCKECRKARVRENRREKAEYYRAYDRKRYRDSDSRKEAARQSAASDAGKRSRAASTRRSRRDHPEKYAARNTVNNALRDGKIQRTPCFFCGGTERLHAHHEDYGHPLDVVWLCPPCHGKLHILRGDMRRGV